jgi:hypothetical protein
MAPRIDKKRISAEGRRLGEAILDDAAPARRLMRPGTVQKLRGELDRLSAPDRPAHVRKFAEAMNQRYPRLRSL